MEVRLNNDGFILVVKGDFNDADYLTKVYGIPLDQKDLADYLFSWLIILQNLYKKRLGFVEDFNEEEDDAEDDSMSEGEEEFLEDFFPDSECEPCHSIVQVEMYKVENGQISEVERPEEPETDVFDFEEISSKYKDAHYDYCW